MNIFLAQVQTTKQMINKEIFCSNKKKSCVNETLKVGMISFIIKTKLGGSEYK